MGCDFRKTMWVINQEGSTPETGMGGRHFYLSKEMATRGCRVYLIMANFNHIMRAPKKNSRRVEIEHRSHNFKVVWVKVPQYLKSNSKQRVINWLLFSWYIQKISKYIQIPDIILFSSPPLIPFLGASKLAKKIGCKLIVDVRDIWPLTLTELGGINKKHPIVWWMKRIEKKAYNQADSIVSNLPYMDSYMREKGLYSKSCKWIPNGICLNEVRNQEPLSQDFKNKMPETQFIIGYTGSLGVSNALDCLVESAFLLKNDTRFSFMVVGNGAEKENLKNKVKSLSLNNFIFMDAVPKSQVQSLLSCFDALWIGSKKTPLYQFGVAMNKIFDYLYSGKPIIYAVDSGDYNPVEISKCGLSVEPENPQALKNAIVNLFSLAGLERENMGLRGKEFVIKQHNYKLVAEKLQAVVEEF